MARSPTLLLFQQLVVFIAIVVLAQHGVSVGAGEALKQQNGKPNVVFIMTDDQDAKLDSMHYMPFTRKHLGSEGATFPHYYVSTSLCCPSRTSFLR